MLVYLMYIVPSAICDPVLPKTATLLENYFCPESSGIHIQFLITSRLGEAYVFDSGRSITRATSNFSTQGAGDRLLVLPIMQSGG